MAESTEIRGEPRVGDYMNRDIKTIPVDATLHEVGQALATYK